MMYHKNGLFFAVNTVIVLMLFLAIAPTPVSAQSDSAARVAIQGPVGEFGDVLLVKDGDDIIIIGLSGAVSGAGKVTVSADGMTPVTVDASFVGHFPIKSGTPIRVPKGSQLASANISFTKAAGGVTVTGTIALSITGDSVRQALSDYASEVDKVLKGEKTSIDKGMPPHILLNVVQESPTDPPLVGKVLLTQRLVVKKSGNAVTLSMVDQLEGIPGAGLNPPIQSFPNISLVGVYGVPVDVNKPDTTKRIHLIDTSSFLDGQFVGNGYFMPFSIPDVNSGNIEAIKAANQQAIQSGLFLAPQVTDIFYLRVQQDLGGGQKHNFLARVNNDITAGIVGDLTIQNNNNNAAGPNASAIIEGKADPYALVTAYAANDRNSDWYASAFADGSGAFKLTIPPTFRSRVYLDVSDPFGNVSSSLREVVTDDQPPVVTESPIATPQPDGTMILTGRTEAGAVIWVEGRVRSNDTRIFVNEGVAGADGAYTISKMPPLFEYFVTITDLAGNRSTTTVPGDQFAQPPSNLAAAAAYPVIRVTGQAEPFSSILTYGFDAGVVPQNPVASDTLPLGAFFLGGSNLENPETTARAGADGKFILSVPVSVGRYIYLRAFDPAGNGSQYVPLELVDENGIPLGKTGAIVEILGVDNRMPGLSDTVHARLINLTTGAPLDGPALGLVAAAFVGMTNSPDTLIPFVDQLTELIPVNSNGTFDLNIPPFSEGTGKFISEFYVVAFSMLDDGSLRDIGYTMVTENDGFDRIGPEITFAPLSSDIVLFEKGAGESDLMSIRRIFPAGTGAGLADLPAGSLPYIFVLADGDGDDEIDIHSSKTYIVDYKPLNFAPQNPFSIPIPGLAGPLDLKSNYWDATTQTVVGNSVVFVALMDNLGNFSPDPIPVHLDVTIQDPDASKIAASGSAIFADEGTVEAFANVSIFETPNKTGLIGTAKAYNNGGFALVNLSIAQEFVYVFSKDAAGNESNLVKVKVDNPVKDMQFFVLDELGAIHSPAGTSWAHAGYNWRSMSKIGDSIYLLSSDGYIYKVAGVGEQPAWEKMVYINNDLARDIEVISVNPFKAYVLLGNGLILKYGDVPFFGDLGTPDTSIQRLPYDDYRMFLDLNGNGVRDTEDANGNGVLDISVGIGGVLETEDTGIAGIADSEGNGILDEEPLIDPTQSSQGFGWDIARDLSLVKDSNGNVKGYVIMDGFGVLWPFGQDIGAENVSPKNTNGIVLGHDIFRDLQLIVKDGKIQDFITMNGKGELFAMPSDQGGVLGGGPSTDSSVAGFLSAKQYGLTIYSFDIARDLALNPVDSNADGTVDWKDGFYILDGFGGIHAAGGAPEITNSPFLGMDIARDLEF